jgi:tetratricopeptide (TPR) repeat protein
MDTDRLLQLQQFLKDDPSDPFVYYALANEYNRLGNAEEAERHYRILLADHPAYVATYYHFGKLLENTDRKEEAIDQYREGIRVADDARDFHSRKELVQALQACLGSEEDY